MKFRLPIFILFCLLPLGSLLLVSCEPDKACHQELQVAVQIILAADSVTAAGDTVAYAQWDSLIVVGVGSDIGMSGKKIKGVGLELRPDTNFTMYLMQYHNQIDTLFIEHTPKQHFVSMACGCAVYHTINKVWSSDSRIENISIINANIETIAQDNICIHLHE